MVNRDDLLDLATAARELGVGRTLLYRLISDGDIAAIKHGRRRFIERQEIADYWTRRRNEAHKVRAHRAKRSAAATARATTAGKDALDSVSRQPAA